jgi:hypothetical protein
MWLNRCQGTELGMSSVMMIGEVSTVPIDTSEVAMERQRYWQAEAVHGEWLEGDAAVSLSDEREDADAERGYPKRPRTLSPFSLKLRRGTN